ncbi:MAG TPA: hypothetical protein VGZ73_22110 [Bryobacteraceae bacterium]|nr:hypothetical protein [Bryobacteraceae bacterium]
MIDGSWYSTNGPAVWGATKPKPIKEMGVAANSVVEGYEYQAQEVLRSISVSTIGRLLISLINASRRTLTIIPVGVNLFSDTKAVPVSCSVDRCANVLTDSVIWFDPTPWGTSMTAKIDPRKNMMPNDVLFHEMIHSLRQMRGLFKPARTGDVFQYVEEYYAVLFTNMFVTEIGRPGSRRADHALTFTPLPAGVSDLDFYLMHKKEVDDLVYEMPDFCKALGGNRGIIPWNPMWCATQVRF